MSDTHRDDHQELGIKVTERSLCVRTLSCVRLLATPETAACQASLSMGA